MPNVLLVVIDAHEQTYTRFVNRVRDVKCKGAGLQDAALVEELRLHPQRVVNNYKPISKESA